MTSPAGRPTVKPIGGCLAFEPVCHPGRAKSRSRSKRQLSTSTPLAALARQMRTVAELKRLMSRRVEPGEAGESKMAAVVGAASDQHYLDDPAFASTYTRLRQENQSFGKRRVQQELTRKGVHAELVAGSLESAYGQVSEEELARRYVARKRMVKPQDDKQTARLVRRLVRCRFFFRHHLQAAQELGDRLQRS